MLDYDVPTGDCTVRNDVCLLTINDGLEEFCTKFDIVYLALLTGVKNNQLCWGHNNLLLIPYNHFLRSNLRDFSIDFVANRS